MVTVAQLRLMLQYMMMSLVSHVAQNGVLETFGNCQVSLIIYIFRFFRFLVGSMMQERREYISQRSLALTAFFHMYTFIMLQFICWPWTFSTVKHEFYKELGNLKFLQRGWFYLSEVFLGGWLFGKCTFFLEDIRERHESLALSRLLSFMQHFRRQYFIWPLSAQGKW